MTAGQARTRAHDVPRQAAKQARLVVPAAIRGKLVDDDLVPFGDGVAPGFWAPNPLALIDALPLGDPIRMRDLQALTVADIAGFLAEVGPRLQLHRNELLREALAASAAWSDMTPPLLRSCYEQLPSLFTADAVREVAEATIGTPLLDGWQAARTAAGVGTQASPAGRGGRAVMRAFGARAVHVIAGNSPLIAAITIVRNAITRGRRGRQSAPNDPLTAVAIAATMAEIDPGHPLTAHLSTLYWKGGASDFESRLYRPEHIEKIVAWGGPASIRHVTRYIQPGLELISLDPKLSSTVIGPEAFASPAEMSKTAALAAADVGVLNQLGCFNARVIYVVTGTDAAGVARANAWGELLYDAVQALPEQVSTKARRFDPDLRAGLTALRACPEWYHVIGGRGDEGAVVVSQLPEPVEFHMALSGRVANVVPVADAAAAATAMNSATQTVGVYPESLKHGLRDVIPFYGVQRLVSLGYATHYRGDLPQDAMEPVRRMVKWVVDESYQPEITPPLCHLSPQDAWHPAGIPEPAAPADRMLAEQEER